MEFALRLGIYVGGRASFRDIPMKLRVQSDVNRRGLTNDDATKSHGRATR